jgi:prepilin-type N-terminal cleavage/methylation domain-containing protein
LKVFAKNAARPWGFTLIELLTVVAIIAVLATLLMATLSDAKRKGRKAACISNLHQIALAYDMYADDQRKRPLLFQDLLNGKYVTQRALICPEDKIYEDWAGKIEEPKQMTAVLTPSGSLPPNPSDAPHSYFKSFDYPNEIWDQIDKSPSGGIAACQLHGIGRQDSANNPSLYAYQGLVLRALKDGSVVSRQVFWTQGNQTTANLTAPVGGASMNNGAVFSGDELPLFLDEVQ